jgi:hypothetical protein
MIHHLDKNNSDKNRGLHFSDHFTGLIFHCPLTNKWIIGQFHVTVEKAVFYSLGFFSHFLRTIFFCSVQPYHKDNTFIADFFPREKWCEPSQHISQYVKCSTKMKKCFELVIYIFLEKNSFLKKIFLVARLLFYGSTEIALRADLVLHIVLLVKK